MNSLLEDDDERRDTNDREVTLNTGVILAIFFGLVLLCGLFFGFGYKMGSHKIAAPVEAAVVESSPTPATDFSGFKPAAGSANGSNSSGSNSSGAAKRDEQEPVEARPARESATADAEPAEAAPIVRETAPVGHATASAPAVESAAPVAAGNFLVQVAAVSHREDAVLLINALRAKGYPVSAHTQPQDQFFHIQVGPFQTHQDAEAAKEKLLADGYQPIIK